jgi:hypothetical protein
VTHLEWPRRVGALGQFHVADPSSPALARDDEHHLRKVLRAKVGEEVVVTDGRGSWAICVVEDTGLRRVSDVMIDEPATSTTLYLAALKGDHAQLAVAKATELGVSRVVPLLTSRTVVKFSGDAGVGWRTKPPVSADEPTTCGSRNRCEFVTFPRTWPSRTWALRETGAGSGTWPWDPRVVGPKASGTHSVGASVLVLRSFVPRRRAW